MIAGYLFLRLACGKTELGGVIVLPRRSWEAESCSAPSLSAARFSSVSPTAIKVA